MGDEIYAKRIVHVQEVEGHYWALVEIGQNISPQAAGHLPVEHKKKYGFEPGSLVAVGSFGLEFLGGIIMSRLSREGGGYR